MYIILKTYGDSSYAELFFQKAGEQPRLAGHLSLRPDELDALRSAILCTHRTGLGLYQHDKGGRPDAQATADAVFATDSPRPATAARPPGTLQRPELGTAPGNLGGLMTDEDAGEPVGGYTEPLPGPNPEHRVALALTPAEGQGPSSPRSESPRNCPCPKCCNERGEVEVEKAHGGACAGHQSICEPKVVSIPVRFLVVSAEGSGGAVGYNVLDSRTGKFRVPEFSLTAAGARGAASRANADPAGFEDNYRY